MRTTQALAILASCLLGGCPAGSLVAAPHPELGKPWIESWTVGDYPSRSHQNWDVHLDAAGLVWTGNGAGVQYFDGARWRLIPTPHSTLVYSLLPAADGRVYLGTTSDFGYLEPGANAEWRFVSLLEGRGDVPQFGNILTVESTPDGVFFHARRTLFRFVPATGELRWLEPRNRFRYAHAAGGELYVADLGVGIFRYAAEDHRLVPVLDWAALGGAELRRLASDGDGRLLVLTAEGLLALDGRGLRRFPTEADAWLRTQRPYEVATLADGSLAVGSRLGGLVVLAPDGGLRRQVGRDHGLPWSWACYMALDRQGGLWAAQEGGVSRIEIDPVLSFFDESLGVQGVEALVRYRGRMVAATMEGLKVLRPSPEPGGQARFAPLAADGEQIWSLLDAGDRLLFGDRDGVSSLRVSPDGTVSSERVYTGRRAVHLARSPRDPSVVWAALEDGVARLRRVDGRWRSEGKLRGVEVPVIYVEQDGDGTLWFGTITGTYYRVRRVGDWPDAAVEAFRQDAGVPKGNAHLFRAGGQLLFGTWDGFRRFTGERFVPDPRFPEGLTDGSLDIHRLAEGPDGRLWIYAGGVTGVAEARPGGGFDWDTRPLARVSGEKVSAIHVDPDGVVWLGRRSGVVRFDPALWQPPAPLPAARVHRVTVAGDAAPLYGGAVAAAGFEGAPLQPARNALRIEFAVADFAAPRVLEYRTRLRGVDGDWTAWTRETRRDFTSLPPGRLDFQVEARNSLGQVAPEGTYRLRLRPPWYRTWPAYLTYLVAGVLLLTGTAGWTARRRTARLEAERRRLSLLVEERAGEIRRQAEELAAEQAAKDRFFANVSHELRTPLTLTLGPLEEAASGRCGPLPADAAESIGTALRGARQLRNLVDQVLDVGRLEAGRMPVAVVPGDLSELVRRVGARFIPSAERAGLILDLAGVEAGVGACFDPSHLDRVVSNLLTNALKFTPAGGRISVNLDRREEGIEIAVQDTGIGIAPEDLPRVFDRYFQAGGTVAQQPGTGIGLALVRELVELHGGTVAAESAPGRGSTFRVFLARGRDPVARDRIASPPEAPEPTLADAPSAPPAPPGAFSDDGEDSRPGADTTTLLIVDDNAELRGFVRRLFATEYRVVEAADGSEALEECRRRVPDLVISDVMMPRMDGLELTRRLKADPDLDFVPVILLTARAASEHAVEGLGVGADDYLRKPFDGAELQARVARLIASLRRLRARFAAPEAAEGLSGADADFDRRLMAAIEERLAAGECTVQSLADALAMDRSHLYRRVQAVRGISPQALILRVRLQAAARLLAGGEGSVSEVAYSVGFNSLSHFSESFRRHWGLPPSRWRQGVREPGRRQAAR